MALTELASSISGQLFTLQDNIISALCSSGYIFFQQISLHIILIGHVQEDDVGETLAIEADIKK